MPESTYPMLKSVRLTTTVAVVTPRHAQSPTAVADHRKTHADNAIACLLSGQLLAKSPQSAPSVGIHPTVVRAVANPLAESRSSSCVEISWSRGLETQFEHVAAIAVAPALTAQIPFAPASPLRLVRLRAAIPPTPTSFCQTPTHQLGRGFPLVVTENPHPAKSAPSPAATNAAAVIR